MLIEQIPLKSLIVNPANDRHGELADEAAAIRWLLEKHEHHMRNLARDIVAEGKIYELPLVGPRGDDYLVFDGNRRVTCLKILADPSRASTPELQAFFESEGLRWKGNEGVTCQVEHSRDDIDEILYRRHTGSQSGIGQRQWDDAAKANFIARTGKKLKVNVAEEIEKKLLEIGVLDRPGQIPRSTANRLFSNDRLRNRVGFVVRDKQLEFTHNPDKALEALTKVVSDLMSDEIVLPDVWTNSDKHNYLDRLEALGKLPTPNETLDKPQGFFSSVAAKPIAQQQKLREEMAAAMRAPRMRDTLIPKDLGYAINWTALTSRQRDIWNELQHRLLLSRHPNAIAVLLRVLIELSVDHYINRTSLANVHPNDKLSLKVKKVAAELLAKKAIETKYHDEVRKIEQAEKVISASTMNSYIHSATFSPSPQHLCAIWDLFSRFVVLCINA